METSERVLSAVIALPGASVARLAGEIGLTESTVSYHLHRLAKAGKVSLSALGRERVWYASDCGLCPVLRRAVPVLRREEARAVAWALEPEPLAATHLAERSGVPAGSVRWILPVLASTGLVGRTPSGRALLRPGAEVCRAKAVAGERCDAWQRCPVSRAWLAERAQRLGGTRAS